MCSSCCCLSCRRVVRVKFWLRVSIYVAHGDTRHQRNTERERQRENAIDVRAVHAYTLRSFPCRRIQQRQRRQRCRLSLTSATIRCCCCCCRDIALVFGVKSAQRRACVDFTPDRQRRPQCADRRSTAFRVQNERRKPKQQQMCYESAERMRSLLGACCGWGLAGWLAGCVCFACAHI